MEVLCSPVRERGGFGAATGAYQATQNLPGTVLKHLVSIILLNSCQSLTVFLPEDGKDMQY